MKIPVQICSECGSEQWNLGKFILHGEKEYTYNVICCASCGNALFYTEGTA